MTEPHSKRIKLETGDADDARNHHALWKQCGHLSEGTRLAIKENALLKAENYATQLSNIIGGCMKDPSLIQDAAFRKWLRNIESNKQRNQAFKVLVGVVGATGAGKTSVLNALLGGVEILPSGHEGAATAVPCLVAWNYDEEPGHEFRARIHAMTKKEVIEELVILVEAFEARRSLQDEDDEDSVDLTPAQKQEELLTVNGEIKKGMEKVHAVFNLEEEEIEAIVEADKDGLGDTGGMTSESKAQKILDTNRAVGKLIDIGARELYATSAEELADEMKSFLDSSSAQHGMESDEEFAAWPIIKEVHVFLRADILQSGICLVDLPGAGEVGASRAQVARNFQEKLEVTLLVAPIHRAADENVAQTLLSSHQAAQMDLEGSFNKRKLGIVLSKIDDLEKRKYIKGIRDARDDPIVKKFQTMMTQSKENINNGKSDKTRLLKLERESQTQMNRLESVHSELQCQDNDGFPIKLEADDSKPKRKKKTKGPPSSEKTKKIFEAKVKASNIHHQARMKLLSISKGKKFFEHRQVVASHGLAYWAVNKRNKRVAERINKDMERRQQKIDKSAKTKAKAEYGAAILPTSSKAFWRIEEEAEVEGPVDGFPRKVYTGIPNLEQWIHLATLDRRETHLNEVLSSYDFAFKGMFNWSTEGERLNMGLTSKDVEDILVETHEQYGKRCRLVFDKFSKELKAIDPFENSRISRQGFISALPKMVERWIMKYPTDNNRDETIAHQTHRAIVARKGADFIAPKSKIRYEWKTGLSTRLVLDVKGCWMLAKDEQAPPIFRAFESELKALWDTYTQSIQDVVDDLGHGLTSHLNDIWEILREVCDHNIRKAEIALEEVFDTTRKVDNVVQKRLDTGLVHFWKVAKSKGGRGSFRRRQRYMINSMRQTAKTIFKNTWNDVSQLFEDSRTAMHERFEEISDEAIAEMKLQISLLLKRVLQEDNSAVDSQKEVRRIIMLWKSAWQHSGSTGDHILEQDLQIPEALDPRHVENAVEPEFGSDLMDDAPQPEYDIEGDFDDFTTIDGIEKAIDRLKKVV